MDFFKKILDLLADLPKLVSQGVVVYKILKSIVPVVQQIAETFDLPQIENLLTPLSRVLEFLEKLFEMFGIDPDDDDDAELAAQSVDVRLQSLVAQYDELENEE